MYFKQLNLNAFQVIPGLSCLPWSPPIFVLWFHLFILPAWPLEASEFAIPTPGHNEPLLFPKHAKPCLSFIPLPGATIHIWTLFPSRASNNSWDVAQTGHGSKHSPGRGNTIIPILERRNLRLTEIKTIVSHTWLINGKAQIRNHAVSSKTYFLFQQSSSGILPPSSVLNPDPLSAAKLSLSSHWQIKLSIPS